MISKLIDSVCNLVTSGDEIIVITAISRCFQVWNNIDEKFVKNFYCSLNFSNHILWSYFLLIFLGDNFFWWGCSRFCFCFISKKWLYHLPKGFAICNGTRINITKEDLLFTPNQTFTEITLLIICLSINVIFCVSKFISETLHLHDFFV